MKDKDKIFLKGYRGIFGTVFVVEGNECQAFEVGCSEFTGLYSLARIEEKTKQVFKKVPSFVDNRKKVLDGKEWQSPSLIVKKIK